ncbi:hypothetical protein FPV67DRAFT_1678222 [Lyophyllum atratum]|nr:hypothetical protein FPV67DRAFT_1678222 [Lyophyllum atratum]
MTKNPNKEYANTWKKEEVKASDNFMKDPQKTDLVVPVMGATGAGKSTFINALVGRDVAKVGHNLQSETAQVQHYILPHPQYPDRRLIIVDTPGFDDTNQDDREILRRIAVWLAQSYDADMTLAGVIYLHEITLTRMTGTARKNLDMFDKLCGPNAGPNIILATTKWNDVKKKVGEHREKDLRATQWKEMIDRGSRMSRFEASQKSAKAIMKLILKREPVDAAQIQQELVENDKFLSDTEAGRTLRYNLEDMLEVQRQKVARLREEGGQDLQEEIANEENIRATLDHMKSLNTAAGLDVDQKIVQGSQTKAVEDLRETTEQGLETKQVVGDRTSVLNSETAATMQSKAGSSSGTTTDFANATIGVFRDVVAGIHRICSNLSCTGIPKTGEECVEQDIGEVVIRMTGEKFITQDSGVIILVLGDTGVGKSTLYSQFINAVAGRPIAEVSHRLISSEPVAKHFIIQHHQRSTRSFILLEAPGFDHYSESDEEILKRIIDWLKASCHEDASFGGIVYLHDITKPRKPSTVHEIPVLLGLSRPELAGHVLVTTVKWGRARQDPSGAGRREQELKANTWKVMLGAGAQTQRFLNTKDSAWGIIDALLQLEPLKLRVLQQGLDEVHRSFTEERLRLERKFKPLFQNFRDS